MDVPLASGRTWRRAVVVAGAVATFACAGDAVAAAPAGSGFALDRLPGVTVAPAGAAERVGARVSVPFAAAPASVAGTVRHVPSAGLRLRAGRRTLTLTGLQVRSGTVSALVAGRRVTVFSAAQAPLRSGAAGALAPRTVALALTARGRALVRTTLRPRRVPAGKVGTLRLTLPIQASAPSSAPLTAAAPAPTTPAAASPAPATPAPTTPVDPTPTPTTPPAAPSAYEIPGLGASVVTSSTAEWAFRGSWLRYLVAGGGSVLTDGGVTKTPDAAFAYPTAPGGTYVPGAGWTLEHAGTVTFSHPNHGIAISLGSPTVTLGPTPAVTLDLTDGSVGGIPGGGAAGGDGTSRRVVFGTLDLSAVTPTVAGATVTWPAVPVLLTAEGAAPFLAYKAGEPFGQITVRATVAPAP